MGGMVRGLMRKLDVEEGWVVEKGEVLLRMEGVE